MNTPRVDRNWLDKQMGLPVTTQARPPKRGGGKTVAIVLGVLVVLGAAGALVADHLCGRPFGILSPAPIDSADREQPAADAASDQASATASAVPLPEIQMRTPASPAVDTSSAQAQYDSAVRALPMLARQRKETEGTIADFRARLALAVRPIDGRTPEQLLIAAVEQAKRGRDGEAEIAAHRRLVDFRSKMTEMRSRLAHEESVLGTILRRIGEATKQRDEAKASLAP